MRILLLTKRTGNALARSENGMGGIMKDRLEDIEEWKKKFNSFGIKELLALKETIYYIDSMNKAYLWKAREYEDQIQKEQSQRLNNIFVAIDGAINVQERDYENQAKEEAERLAELPRGNG